jgi:hypothetical protein
MSTKAECPVVLELRARRMGKTKLMNDFEDKNLKWICDDAINTVMTAKKVSLTEAATLLFNESRWNLKAKMYFSSIVTKVRY